MWSLLFTKIGGTLIFVSDPDRRLLNALFDAVHGDNLVPGGSDS
jgi:hypothetical protein